MRRRRNPLAAQAWKMALIAGVAPLALLPTAANAQSATAPGNIAQGGKLEEVTVTAARRAQSIQKTSIAVTAISGTTIQKRGETDLLTVLQNVPSVSMDQAQHGFAVAIRGQGNDLLPPGSGQGAVALENDGVYNLLGESNLVGFFDLNRVEVLPGPQGTLYGVNSDGGVVNIITNNPVIGQFSGAAALTVGNYALFREEAHLNIPVNDVMAMRIAGAIINRKGYYTPDQDDAVAQSGRFKVLYKPDDKLSVLFQYQLDHLGGEGPSSALWITYPNGEINNSKLYGNPWSYGDYTTSGPNLNNSHLSQYIETYQGNISYQIGDLAVLNVLPAFIHSQSKINLCGANLYPGAVGPGVCAVRYDPGQYRDFSSEERFTNTPGSFLQWDLGAYHWNYTILSAGRGNPSVYGTASNAGFGELTYSVMPTLRLIGGLRQSFDSRTDLETPTNAKSSWYTARASFSHFDYRLGVEWDTAPRSMQYFTISTGYRPGGFNENQIPGQPPSLYRNEQITSFELGSKNRFLDDRLQLNGDIFYYDQKNYQLVDQYTPDNPVCDNSNPADVPSYCDSPTLNVSAHVLGLEFQNRYNLTLNDQISASGTFLDAKFSNKQNDNGCVSTAVGAPAGACYFAYNGVANFHNNVYFSKINGLVQAHSPVVAGEFEYAHIFNFPSGATLTPGVQIFASADYYVTPTEFGYTRQPAYWTQGVTLDYASAGGRWSLNGYIKNISNYAVLGSFEPDTLLDPRTYGVVGTINF